MVEVSDLAKSYGPKQVLEDVSFTIDRGDRIALVGVNGAGKSTLIRMLSGMEPPPSGNLRLGHNVTAEYFAQDQYKVLDPNARMLDDISSIAPRVPRPICAACWAASCSPATMSSSPWACSPAASATATRWPAFWSARRTFCCWTSPRTTSTCAPRTCCSKPSPHFTGTVIFVSHDRYFIDRLATRVFEVEGGHVHVYPGNYEDYLCRKQAVETQVNRSNGVAAAQEPEKASPEATAAKGRRVNPIKLRQMQERCSFVEAEIPRLESSIADAEVSLGVYESTEETLRLTQMLESLRQQHASLTAEWEELVLQLEQQA